MRTTGNINFVLIGAKATGKTVYLASLFLNEKRVTSKDGHTIEYLKPLSDSLLEGEYPQATAGSYHELKFNYKDNNISCHIQIDDVDGYFVETMHETDEATQKQRDILLKNIKNSEGIIFFFPYEKSFNEQSIKNFNYEIDTIISKLTDMYSKYDYIPIPAVIAVSKWDRSPYFKSHDEEEKALEYIHDNKFLKLAMEKIKHNFPNLMIVPISAIGKDIHKMEPYNLVKPIQFFLKETYKLWDNKIDKLKDDKRALLIFLSKVHFDMKFYKDGKYNKMYDELEKEYATKLFSELDSVKSYEEFEKFKEENRDVISSLVPKNREKIKEIGKKLKSKQKKKKLTIGSIVLVFFIMILVGSGTWYVKTKLMKSESELFSDISVAYKNHNYKEAMEDIARYQNDFKDTIDANQKNRVEEMKGEISSSYSAKLDKILQNSSLLKQYDELEILQREVSKFGNAMDTTQIENKLAEIRKLKEGYQKVLAFSKDDISQLNEISTILNQLAVHKFSEAISLKNKFAESLIAMANNLISEEELDNADKLENILNAFTTLGIDSPETVQKLIDKKNGVIINGNFETLKADIKKKSYEDAILKVETEWRENYSEDKKKIIGRLLNHKFNQIVEKKLKEISGITDVDEFNKLVDAINDISNLEKRTQIAKIDYKPTKYQSNQNEYDKKYEEYKKYHDALKYGVSDIKITFGATSKDNEPLGFECDGGDDEIILKLEAVEYHYDNGDCHDGMQMSWQSQSQQSFERGTQYSITVIEEDYGLNPNDEYSFKFVLSSSDLIKMVKKEYFEKDLGNNYFIGFGDKRR